MPHRVSTPHVQGSQRYGGESIASTKIGRTVSVTYCARLVSPYPVGAWLPPLDPLDVRHAQQPVWAYPQHHEGDQIGRNRTEAPAHQGMNKAPCGWTLSTSTLSSGASPLRGGGIRAAFDPLCLVIDHPIRWVPDAPHPHLTPTVRTDQGVPSRTLLVPLPIG